MRVKTTLEVRVKRRLEARVKAKLRDNNDINIKVNESYAKMTGSAGLWAA